MKNKSPRGIPDFSRQASRPKHTPRPDAQGSTKGSKGTTSPAPRAKPQSTSGKSGQRGK